MTIPTDFIPSDDLFIPEKSAIPPTTPKKDYVREVAEIMRRLSARKGKTVAARVIRVDEEIDLNATFDKLCLSYLDAFVFMFSSSKTGTWLGASPELLIHRHGSSIATVALAGTRPANSVGDWDCKNIEEQEMVAEYLRRILLKHCGKIDSETTFTRQAGEIEHISTVMWSDLKVENPANNRMIMESLASLLGDMAPTPALCGYYRTQSMNLIRETETFDREMYGGFCGPNCYESETDLYVIVRSAKCNDNGVAVFVGGGITRLSDVESEWHETEMKSKTIINCIKSNDK